MCAVTGDVDMLPADPYRVAAREVTEAAALYGWLPDGDWPGSLVSAWVAERGV
jgi:hypothetical protein